MNLKNLKNLNITRISELTKIEMQIAFTIGILIGALASWIFILLMANMEWYFKLFATIGEIGLVGSLVLALVELFKVRKSLAEAFKQMRMIESQQNDNKDIKEYTG